MMLDKRRFQVTRFIITLVLMILGHSDLFSQDMLLKVDYRSQIQTSDRHQTETGTLTFHGVFDGVCVWEIQLKVEGRLASLEATFTEQGEFLVTGLLEGRMVYQEQKLFNPEGVARFILTLDQIGEIISAILFGSKPFFKPSNGIVETDTTDEEPDPDGIVETDTTDEEPAPDGIVETDTTDEEPDPDGVPN